MTTFNQPSDIIAEQRDRLAIATYQHKNKLPLIMFTECYIYFDEWVQIVRVNQEFEDGYMEVVVENRSGTRAVVQLDELGWKFGRRMDELRREKQWIDIWTQFEFEQSEASGDE